MLPTKSQIERIWYAMDRFLTAVCERRGYNINNLAVAIAAHLLEKYGNG